MTDSWVKSQEISSELWKGKIPIVIDVMASEIATLTPPKALYLFVPRMGYLSLLWNDIFEHFEQFFPPGSSRNTMWFEHQQRPIKWHLPFGVLYDSLIQNSADDKTLPMQFTIHFQNYPMQQILPIDGDISNESHYMHSLKQAFYIKYGSPKHIMEMPQALQLQLWSGVQTNSRDLFHQAYTALVPDEVPIRSIPIRILRPHQPLFQLPISVKEHLTLGQMVLNRLSRSVDHQKFEVWMQGIVIYEKDYHVPLDRLYQEFAHPDGFLYLCVKPLS